MAGLNKRNLLKKKKRVCQLLFKESSNSGWGSEEGGGGAQIAPNQGTSPTDQSGAAGAQRDSSPQRDLI